MIEKRKFKKFNSQYGTDGNNCYYINDKVQFMPFTVVFFFLIFKILPEMAEKCPFEKFIPYDAKQLEWAKADLAKTHVCIEKKNVVLGCTALGNP